ncbi:MAG: hypothetical protein ABI456_15135, partial [Ktedonobacteraceae bacterium]
IQKRGERVVGTGRRPAAPLHERRGHIGERTGRMPARKRSACRVQAPLACALFQHDISSSIEYQPMWRASPLRIGSRHACQMRKRSATD